MLEEALRQMQALSRGLNATEAEEIIALKFDRAGTTCALVLVDELGMPIQNVEYKKEG